MKYRKKPVVIEARQFLGDINSDELAAWCGGLFLCQSGSNPPHPNDIWYGFDIPTLEGNLCAEVGDYIIKGVDGEFYTCKPYIFEKIYEAV